MSIKKEEMKKINLKTFNFYPDFSNEELRKKSSALIKKIKIKDIDNFEIFNFHDLASNFDEEILKNVYEFGSEIYNQKIEDLIIVGNDKIFSNFNFAHNFLLKNNLLNDKKINLIFISENDSTVVLNEKIKYIKEIISLKKTGLVLMGFKKTTNEFFNFVKHLINLLQINIGYFNLHKSIFIIGKETFEEQFSYLKINEKNTLIVPNILPNTYSFFSEPNLFLLLLDNINIEEVLEGYRQGSLEWINNKITENFAFQYAYCLNFLTKEKEIIINLSNKYYLKNSLNEISKIRNGFYNGKVISYSFTYPNDIFLIGQHLTENNKNILVSNFIVKNENVDYKISDDINNEDNLKEYSSYTINFLSNMSDNIVNDLIVNIGSIPLIEIEIEDISNISLGIFISFLYWSSIFEKILLNLEMSI